MQQSEKFLARLAKLPAAGGDDRIGRFTLQPARYAKDTVAIRCPSNTIWKTAAACELGNARYSGRENAYMVSIARAEKFVASLEEQKQEQREAT